MPALSGPGRPKVREGSGRPRVLLSAYACSPYRGSEPGLGWNWVREIAKNFDTWVLCKKESYEPDIERYFTEHGEIPGLNFCFIPLSPTDEFLRNTPGCYYLAYNRWQRRASRYAAGLHQKLHFGLVHQLNFVTFREPGYLWDLGIPFLWGPISGTENYPWRFLGESGVSEALKEGSRSLINGLQLYCSRRVRRAMQTAEVVLSVNSEGEGIFKRLFRVNPVLMSDVGIKTLNPDKSRSYEPGRPLRLLWSGLFEGRKALPLLLRALGQLPPEVAYELRILGDGPLKEHWQELARRAGVSSLCTWLGWLPHQEALAQFDWADLFVFTSLRDSSGTVVLEALGHGVPVICLDHQGSHDMVTPGCGIKIPVTNPDEVAAKLREAIISLDADRQRLAVLSEGAAQRAHDYLWACKGQQMTRIYREVLANGYGSIQSVA
jgi:glycosyltransferase involved in cell wall biosynthesis